MNSNTASEIPPALKTSPAFPWRFWLLIVAISTLGILGSWLLNRGMKQKFPEMFQPIPRYGQIQGDLEAKDRNGKPVRFSEMKGKIIACSYLYTKCPHGCAEVFGTMKILHEKYGSNPDFHLVNVAVAPDLDPPDFLDAFANSQGLAGKTGWTFMSGHPRQTGWDFMHQQLRLEETKEIPPAERMSACDICDHDLRIVLIDSTLQIRGFYQVMVASKETREFMQEKLVKDVGRLLAGE